MKSKEKEKRTAGFSRGYVLYSPLLSTTTYLIDSDKNLVHTWESEFPPGVSAYLLDNGNLLRTARSPDVPFYLSPGQGGCMQEYTWEGELVWYFSLVSENRIQHHDIEPLPNGNVLAIVWERKTRRILYFAPLISPKPTRPSNIENSTHSIVRQRGALCAMVESL